MSVPLTASAICCVVIVVGVFGAFIECVCGVRR